MVDLWRDFSVRESGTGQQVAQLHERYMVMMMMMIMKSITILNHVYKDWSYIQVDNSLVQIWQYEGSP